jgi:hypothetical protein
MCHTSFKLLRKRHKEEGPYKPSRERLQGDDDIVLPKWRGRESKG